MKVFIFGAGASYGAPTETIWDKFRAPLTDAIFNGVYGEYAKSVGLSIVDITRFTEEIKKFPTLENWLTDKWEKAKSKNDPKIKDIYFREIALISIYIWYMLLKISESIYLNERGVRDHNAYRILLRKLQQADQMPGLISFNYDLFLDFAFKDVYGETLGSIDEYLDNNFIKPHGSVNWLLNKRADDPEIDLSKEHNLDTKTRINMTIKYLYREAQIDFDPVIKDPDHRDIYILSDLYRVFKNQYFYPLIFIPILKKDFSTIHGFEDKVIKQGHEMISKAREIYLIGYGAKDDIIKTLLPSAKEGTKLYVVAPNSADKIMSEVLKMAPRLVKGDVPYKGTFVDFVNFKSFT